MQVQERVINGFRLSPQQKRVWSLQQDSLAYCVQAAILLEGNLKKDTLKLALEQVISRQDILRTHFLKPTGVKTPVQVINEKVSLFWQEIDLSDAAKGGWQGHRDSQAQLKQVESLLREARLISSNFEEGLVLHSSLINLSANKHILLVNLPALCGDSYTIEILIQEISQCYNACLQGIQLSNEEIVQYLQFSEWQNELLEDADAELGKKYWKKYNLSALPEITLPFGNNLLADSPKFQINSFEVKIDSKLLSQIEAIAHKYNSSLANFLLTCWQVLLWRFTEESHLIIGIAANGRKYEELETVIGLLTKYLPLSAKLEESFSFKEVLQEINKSVQEAEEWQEYFSWQNLAESQNINPDSVYLPFSFEFQAETAKYSAGNITFSIYQQFACTDRFKIRLSCIQQENILVATFDYDANLFSVEDIKRLAEHFQTLLESAIANPEIEISKLRVLSDRHLHQLLIEFNNLETRHDNVETRHSASLHKCFHQLFEEQAQRTPDSIAVVFEDQKLTYAELNACANQLAHYLQKLGVKPEVLVGICLDHSLEVIVALLGILKAGGAYLPLDPALPADNISLRLQGAQATILLTQQQLYVEKLDQTSLHEQGILVFCLDFKACEDRLSVFSPTLQGAGFEYIAITESTENPQSNVTSENLAYVIYTSGSTGKPKGVAIEHQQLLNYLHGILKRLNLPAGASFATVSTIAADLGNTAIFPALCTGGCLHIVAKRASDPEALATYFNHHPIDCLKIVPSHLEALLTSSQFNSILPRQKLILGGEAAPWKLIEKIQKLAPECTIINHYGPTEATVGVLTYTLGKDSDNRPSATVPLGRPIANTQIYLLDKHLQPVPIGVKGELYIGGASVARGYLHVPELTEQKFISNPFVEATIGNCPRLYKTGDMARYLPDGNIEFLGRVDYQVKIRGYRVELGEIEAVLSQHSQVRQAVVMAREDKPGDSRLVAYIVSHPGQTPSFDELRKYLKERLPEYMLPSAFVQLKTLPLTSNGKVDRQALPALERVRPELRETFVAPSTPIEKALAEIWAKVLGLEKIGIYDNFFDLGGHSLLIIQLLAEVRDAFQVQLPLRTLFDAPTIARLAESIEIALQGLSGSLTSVLFSCLVPIQPKGNRSPFFCVHPVGGNVICYADLARHLGNEQPFYGLQSVGLNGEQKPITNIEEMATHYIKAIQTIQPTGPYYIGGWSLGGVIAFEIAQQLSVAGQEIALLALIDSYTPKVIEQLSEQRKRVFSQELSDRTIDDATLVSYYFAQDLASVLRKDLLISLDNLQGLDLDAQLTYILEQARIAKVLPSELELPQISRLFHVFQANIQARLGYRPQPYQGSIVWFCAREQAKELTADSSQGWDNLAIGGIEKHLIHGGHYEIIKSPALAEKLKFYLT